MYTRDVVSVTLNSRCKAILEPLVGNEAARYGGGCEVSVGQSCRHAVQQWRNGRAVVLQRCRTSQLQNVSTAFRSARSRKWRLHVGYHDALLSQFSPAQTKRIGQEPEEPERP